MGGVLTLCMVVALREHRGGGEGLFFFSMPPLLDTPPDTKPAGDRKQDCQCARTRNHNSGAHHCQWLKFSVTRHAAEGTNHSTP